jgi:GT2 family glycosyltransferase
VEANSDKHPSVAVIIVNWNGEAVIGACIDSVLEQEYPGEVSVIALDNASTDDSVALLETYGSRVNVIPLKENLGFGRGNNVAFMESTADYVLFLNPDTEFLTKDGLSRLAARLRDPTIGLVAPRLMNSDGTTQQSCSTIPSISNQTAAMLGLPRLLPDKYRRRLAPVLWSHNSSTETGWVGGACMLMRSTDYRKVGGFSERTFMYGEDLELCYQVKSIGFRVYYERTAQVLHLGDHSSTQRWTDADTAGRTAEGELIFLHVRYSPRRAECARQILRAGYSARARILRRLGRTDRAAIYRAMATALSRRSVAGQARSVARSSL